MGTYLVTVHFSEIIEENLEKGKVWEEIYSCLLRYYGIWEN